LHCKTSEDEIRSSYKIVEYLAFVERQRERLPKRVHADNVKEYVNNDLQSWCTERGIILKFTAPYSPQQNGVAERYNGTLADIVRAMLIGNKLPKVLWGTAVLHATYLRNRAYTSTIPDATPFEQWSTKRPDVKTLCEFGTPVSILNESLEQDKLDARGDIHIFVGYDNGPKAVRYFDVKTRQVKTSRNYQFLSHPVDNPPRFEGETLGEDESLWELPEQVQNPPLMIRIPKHKSTDDGSDSRMPK
jgi:hypothetical protein